MSEDQRKKLVADLRAQWNAMPADQQNAMQKGIQERRERRRARRNGGGNGGNGADQTSSDDYGGSGNAVDSDPGDSPSSGGTAMTTGVPVTLLTAVVTLLALLFYFWTGLNVGRMRGKHNIKAPAMTGDPEFERAVRVQMNTLEWLVLFLPLLWLATMYFSPAMTIMWLSWLPPILGVIWIIGRFIYMQGYMVAADKRGPGFGVAGIAVIGLFILSVIGIVLAWTATNAA